MQTFLPGKHHLREALLFMFNLKKNASAAHQSLVEAYGDHALCERACREWFQRFKIGDYNVNDKEHGKQAHTKIPR